MLTKEEQKDFEKAFETYMKKDGWRSEYKNAPSEECKDYLKYTYYDCMFYDPGKDTARLDELKKYYEDRLSVADWEYLKSQAGNSPFVVYCLQKIAGLSK